MAHKPYDERVDGTWQDLIFENYVFSLGRISELGPGGYSERVGPWLCIDAGLGESAFNVAVLVGGLGQGASRTLELAQRWFDERQLNSRFDLRSWVDGELIAAAALAGYAHWWTEPALLLDSVRDAFGYPPGFEARVLNGPADARAYSQLDPMEYDHAFQEAMAETAMRMPGCALLLGFHESVPVARSMANTTGRVVGVHNVYVPPAQRGRGFGAAITAAAITAGREAGATAACLEASELGLPVYLKMGFRKLGEYVIVGKDAPPAFG